MTESEKKQMGRPVGREGPLDATFIIRVSKTMKAALELIGTKKIRDCLRGLITFNKHTTGGK